MKPVRISADRWNFETAPGEFITPLGGAAGVWLVWRRHLEVAL